MAFSAITDLLSSTLRVSTPLILMALGSLLCQRTSIFNIAFEGLSLLGAFSGVAFVIFFNGNAWMGLVGGILAGMLFAAVYALFVIRFKADYVIASIAINVLGLGLTSYLLRAMFHAQGRIAAKNIVKLGMINIPVLKNIPILNALSGQSIVTYFALIMVVLIYFLLFKTKYGLNICAVGESEIVAVTAGVNSAAIRFKVLLAAGAFAGLAGAYLSTVVVSQFSENMIQGRGYNAFTAMVFGNAHPVASMLVCLLLGLADALGIRIELSGFNIPPSLINMFPFLLALAALSISSYITKLRLKRASR